MPLTTNATLPAQVPPPDLALSELPPHAVAGAAVVALPVLPGDDGPVLGPGAEVLLAGTAGRPPLDLFGVLELERHTGAAGEVAVVPVPQTDAQDETDGSDGATALRCVLLVGVGSCSGDDLRRAGAALGRATRDRDLVATTVPSVADDDGLEAFVAGLTLGSFVFHWRSTPPEHRPVERVVVAGVADVGARTAALDRAVAIARAGWRSRQLATVPSNVKDPAWLAEQARNAAEESGLAVRVWDEQQLAADGFGGILGVGRASASPPRLVRLDYTPRHTGRRTPTVALVGKGITFDSGGLSIKPGQSMVTMKRDMTGGAVVIATMAALTAVGCPLRVVGLVPTAENAVGGDALRPGDVIRHYGGRTSEVTNTDAEGRLVLADAIAYAVQEVEADVVVDVATLTGAMKVALGQGTGGLFANDDALADALRTASLAAGEPLWRMPLAEAYEPKLSSTVADADNAPGGPGAIVAALFLQHFVAGRPWAHLDIASVGDAPEDRDEWTTGPTGFGARALLRWLGSDDPLAGVGA